MARYSKFHLQKVGNAFRYRRRIPTALIPILDGKPEWSKYLGQLGERDAIVEARKLDVEHDAVIARVGAGFSDVGVTAVWRALADVGEAPRHEVAGVVGRGCGGLYGDLPIAPAVAVIVGSASVARLDARSGGDRAVFDA